MTNSIPNKNQQTPSKPAVTISLLLLVSSVLVACSDDNTIALPADKAQDIQGVWERPGYGTLLNIDGIELTVYELTLATCYLRDTGLAAEFISDFPIVNVDENQL